MPLGFFYKNKQVIPACLFFLCHGGFSISKKGAIFAKIW